jgi:hypothetical protein
MLDGHSWDGAPGGMRFLNRRSPFPSVDGVGNAAVCSALRMASPFSLRDSGLSLNMPPCSISNEDIFTHAARTGYCTELDR